LLKKTHVGIKLGYWVLWIYKLSILIHTVKRAESKRKKH